MSGVANNESLHPEWCEIILYLLLFLVFAWAVAKITKSQNHKKNF
jgi:flagellar biogenesis protein FliO